MKKLALASLFFALSFALPSPCLRADDVIIGEDDEGVIDGTTTDVTLRWSASPEKDVAGYNVYYGRSSGDYIRIVTATATTVTIGVRGTKTYYFAVTAFDTGGLESDFSDEVHYP